MIWIFRGWLPTQITWSELQILKASALSQWTEDDHKNFPNLSVFLVSIRQCLNLTMISLVTLSGWQSVSYPHDYSAVGNSGALINLVGLPIGHTDWASSSDHNMIINDDPSYMWRSRIVTTERNTMKYKYHWKDKSRWTPKELGSDGSPSELHPVMKKFTWVNLQIQIFCLAFTYRMSVFWMVKFTKWERRFSDPLELGECFRNRFMNFTESR